jgi:hypothetical protein
MRRDTWNDVPRHRKTVRVLSVYEHCFAIGATARFTVLAGDGKPRSPRTAHRGK